MVTPYIANARKSDSPPLHVQSKMISKISVKCPETNKGNITYKNNYK
jgi:hypothetical protein